QSAEDQEAGRVRARHGPGSRAWQGADALRAAAGGGLPRRLAWRGGLARSGARLGGLRGLLLDLAQLLRLAGLVRVRRAALDKAGANRNHVAGVVAGHDVSNLDPTTGGV